MDDNEKMESLAKELMSIRREADKVKYNDVAAYCVARHEDTLKLFMSMAKFIEDNISLFYDPTWHWIGCASEAQRNTRNSMKMEFTDSSRKRPVLWKCSGIKFVYYLEDKRVIFITKDNGSGRGYLWDVKWHYIKHPYEDCMFHAGYEQFVKTPTLENYFGDKWDLNKGKLEYEDFKALKDAIDEDWKNAKQCEDALKETIGALLTEERDRMKGIKDMVASATSNNVET